MIVFINPDDMAELGLEEDSRVALLSDAHDNIERRLEGLQVVPYNILRHSIAGYYPECNGLNPLSHFAEGAKVPAAKSVPVRIVTEEKHLDIA